MTITNRTKIYVLLGLSALLSPLTAHAAFITLSPTTAVNAVNDGDTITLDISLDFTADPTIGGGFNIVFDQSALQFSSFSQNTVGDPGFTRVPDILTGRLSGWAVGDFNGIAGPAILGSVTFDVLATMDANTSVFAQDNLSLLGPGPFFSSVTFAQQIVTYNSVDIVRATVTPPTPAPEPATIMLFGLGMLIAGAQRSRNKRD